MTRKMFRHETKVSRFTKNLLTSGLVLSAAFSLPAENLVRNGSFESEKNGFAADWQIVPIMQGEGMAVLDTQLAVSGKKSLRLVKSGEKGSFSCSQQIALPPAPAGALRKLDVCVHACADKASGGQLVIVTYGADKKTLSWTPLFKFGGTFEFKPFRKTLELPPEAVSLSLSFRAPGPGGVLWVDDVSLELTNEAPVPCAVLDFRGELSPFTGLPGSWKEKKYTGNENVSDIRIEEDNGAPAAVQSYRTGGPLSGFSAELPAALLSQKFITLAGSFRTADGGSVRIGLEFFDRRGNPVGEVLTPPLSSDAWKEFSQNFAVPPSAASASLLLLNTGRTEVRFGPFQAGPGTAEGALALSAPAIQVRVYPVDHSLQQLGVNVPEFNTFTNSPTKLTFHFTGDKARMKAPTLCIDLPAEVRIADAICPHPNVFRQEKFSVAPVTRPEGAYRRWTFVSTKGMQMAGKTPLYQRRLVVLIMPEKEGTVFNGRKVFYHLMNDGVTVQEGSFCLNMLPAMPKTPNPKRFIFQRWNDEDITWVDPEAFAASLLCQEEAHYTWVTRNSDPAFRESRELFEKRGWHFYLRGTPNNSLMYYGGVREMPVEKAVDVNGTVLNRICPSFLTFNEEFLPIRDAIIEKSIALRSPKPGEYVMSDNEQWQPMDWCFCLRCRTEFAKLNGLPSVPDAKTIRSDYAEPWRDFRVEHERRLVEAVYTCAKKHDLVYGDYDYVVDYSLPDYRNRFFSVAKDPKLNEAWQDFHLTSYYHFLDAACFDMLSVGAKYLKKPCIPILAVDGAGGYLSLAEVLDPARFRMMLLTCAVTGCRGASIYPGERLDGKFYLAADQAMKEIASLEDYFLDGEPAEEFEVKALPFITVVVQNPDGDLTMEWPRWNRFFRSNVRQLNGRKLISLLNYNPSETAFVRITLPASGEDRSFGEYITQGKLTLPAGERELFVAVPPRDARMILCGADVPADFTPMPSRESVLSAFEREKIQFQSKAGAAPMPAWKKQNAEFSYSDLDSDGVPEAVLRNGKLTLTIAPDNGRIVRLELDGTVFPGTELSAGFLAETKLWAPKEFRNHLSFENASFVSAGVRDDGLYTAELLLNGGPSGLEIRRTYILTPDAGFRIETTYRNTGGSPLTVIPWTRSVFTWKNVRKDVLFGRLDNAESALDRGSSDCKVTLPLFEKSPSSVPRGGSVLQADAPVLRHVFPEGGIQLHYRPDESLTTAFYLFTDGKTATVEWHDADLTLKPGESRSVRDEYFVEKAPGS